MSDIIDITVQETIDVVEINVTTNLIEVNVIRTSGGGGTQTLEQTLILGPRTGGRNIIIDDTDAVELSNGSLLKKGNYDFGGAGGISRICSVGYEDNWQSGIHHVFDNNGFIRHSTNCFNYIPDNTYDDRLRFKIGSLWTLDDGTSYVCTDATHNFAVWEIVITTPNLQQVTDIGSITTNPITVGDAVAGKRTEYRDLGVILYDEDLYPGEDAGGFTFGQFQIKDINTNNDSYIVGLVDSINNLIGIDFRKIGKSVRVILPTNLIGTMTQLILPSKTNGNYTIATLEDIPAAQIQSDWNQTNNTLLDYIKNKPTIPSLTGVELQANKQNSLTVDGTGVKYPTVDAVNAGLVDVNTNAVDRITVKLSTAINKGQAVYVSSANGTNIIVSKASNATEATSSKTLGLLETTGATNAIVNVITGGLLAGLDTSTATIGDPVWLGTSGNLIFGLASKPVAPAHLVTIGIVSRVSATVGEIIVRVQNGFELEELHNCSIVSVANEDFLQYESSTSLWKNIQLTATWIRSKLGITTLSGSNTGDETTATIKTKLGITTLSGSNTGDQDLSGYSLLANTPAVILNDMRTSSAVTGTTALTILNSYLAPANTFAAFDRLQFDYLGLKSTAVGTASYRIYINTTNSLSGATQIATFGNALGSKFQLMQRNAAFKSATTLEIMLTTTPNQYDLGTDTTLPSTVTYDTTQAYYIITAVLPTSASDSFTQSRFAITRSKSKNTI